MNSEYHTPPIQAHYSLFIIKRPLFTNHYTPSGCIAFAHFLQLAMISFEHILRFHLRTIFTPQSGAISD